MNILSAFPSKYLKASDLNDTDQIFTIKSVTMETFDNGKETKPAIMFRESDRGLLLNKVNSNTIANMYGAETDDWIGKRITLFAMQVDFQGKQVEAIRVRIRPPATGGAAASGNGAAPASGPSAKAKAWTAFGIAQTGESKENIAAAWKRAIHNYFGPSKQADEITSAEWDKFRNDDFSLPPTNAQLSGESQISDDDIPF